MYPYPCYFLSGGTDLTMKILVVDDDTLIRKWMTLFAGAVRKTLEILQAENGADALALVQENPGTGSDYYRYQMPLMNGLELCECVKRLYPSVCIVILSSYDDFSYIKQALRLEATDHILKAEMNAEDIANALQKAQQFKIQHTLSNMPSQRKPTDGQVAAPAGIPRAAERQHTDVPFLTRPTAFPAEPFNFSAQAVLSLVGRYFRYTAEMISLTLNEQGASRRMQLTHGKSSLCFATTCSNTVILTIPPHISARFPPASSGRPAESPHGPQCTSGRPPSCRTT